MSTTLILPLSMVMAFVSYTLAFRWYAKPKLEQADFATAMKPLLLLHSTRFIGLMFLIPGVTAEALDPRFAWPAAYGDLLAAALALVALFSLNAPSRIAIALVALFNVVGFLDLINAVVRGLAYTPDGALGAAFWIPMVIVPLLIVTHIYIFARLVTEVRSGHLPAPRIRAS